MDNREAIIQATILLIEENGENLEAITVREICQRADVGLGLVNYHFGSKEKLMEVCVERMINGIVAHFQEIREATKNFTPFENLKYLGNMTFDYLFAHQTVAKISALTDMKKPKEDDNTHRTYMAYLPLVEACRPDWDEETVKRRTFSLVAAMQQAFLRQEAVSQMLGMDLTDKECRHQFHTQILKDILEVRE